MKKITKVLAYIILAVVSFVIGYYLSYTLEEKEKEFSNTKNVDKLTADRNVKRNK